MMRVFRTVKILFINPSNSDRLDGFQTDLAVLGPFFPYDSIFSQRIQSGLVIFVIIKTKNHKDTCSDARDNPVESDIFTGF